LLIFKFESVTYFKQRGFKILWQLVIGRRVMVKVCQK